MALLSHIFELFLIDMQKYHHLLLGGTGFIGTELAAVLQKNTGEKVLCIGKDKSNTLPQGVDFLQEDVGAKEAQWKHVCAHNIFILFGQNSSNFDPEKELSLLKNVIDSINQLTESASLFYFSTALVYGDTKEVTSEADVPNPVESYSQFKYEAEKYIQKHLEKRHKLCVFRLANVYGSPRNRGFIGRMCKIAKEGGTLTVYGSGIQERDYIYIDDVTEAICSVLYKQAKSKLGTREILNVATGKTSTLNEVIKWFEETTGKKISKTVVTETPEEARRNKPSNKKLKEVYNFEPKISLKDGLKRTWKKYENL